MRKHCFTLIILFLIFSFAENSTAQYIQTDTLNGWKITATNGAIDSAYSRIIFGNSTEGMHSQSFRMKLSAKNESYYAEWTKEYKPFIVPVGQFIMISIFSADLEPPPPGYFSLGFIDFFIGNGDTLANYGTFQFVDGLTTWMDIQFVLKTRVIDRMKIRLRIAILSGYVEIFLDNFSFGPNIFNRTTVDGFGDPLTSVDENSQPPEKFSLSQNFPNPFNSGTVISFKLKVSSFITLKVYDVLGRKVAVFVDGELPAGEHKITFTPEATLPSGMYLYRLTAGKFTKTKKMLLLK